MPKQKNIEYFQEAWEQHLSLFQQLAEWDEPLTNIARIMSDSLKNGHKIMFCGNGGSAGDSQHLAAEFIGRFDKDREPLAALALTTDSSILTCVSNDYSFDEVFARQVKGLGKAGDCLVAISTSGNSPNVIKAIDVARKMGIITIALTGRSGGKMVSLADHSLIVPSLITARIQEMHIFIGHVLCGMIEFRLGKRHLAL